MAKIALPSEVAAMFAACEGAYERATEEGYGDSPNVISAVSKLKSAWKELHIENSNLAMAKGFFAVEFASIRFERACRASREACINLHAAIKEAAAEHRLYNRCLLMANSSPDADQADDAATAQQNERLRRQA